MNQNLRIISKELLTDANIRILEGHKYGLLLKDSYLKRMGFPLCKEIENNSFLLLPYAQKGITVKLVRN